MMHKFLTSWWPLIIALGIFLLPSARSQQQPPAKLPDPELAQLISDVSAQQAQIIANHVKINATITEVEENVRQARIFVSRSGRGGGKTP